MGKPHLVVVGNGMAGVKLLEELVRLAPGRYRITVFGAEPRAAYNRVLLSPLLAGEYALEQLTLQPLAWYAAQGISLHCGDPVVRIDSRRQRVMTQRGQVVHYDRLVLATGAEPMRLPVAGCELDGVVDFRTVEDVERMLACRREGRRAVVVGAGLLGLEAAYGLVRRGFAVTVVQRSEWLLNRQLDREAATYLQRALARQGIDFRLGVKVRRLAGERQVRGVELDSGERLAAELVVMAIGIRPRVELARAAGLECQRGIVVDDHLQTSAASVLALGECIEHRGATFGLLAPIQAQAQLLARRLAGQFDLAYRPQQTATRLKVSGIDLFSAGDISGADAQALILRDPAGGVYKKLLLRDERLVGVVLYGDVQDGQWYFDQLLAQRSLAEVRDQLIFGRRYCALSDVASDGQLQRRIA